MPHRTHADGVAELTGECLASLGGGHLVVQEIGFTQHFLLIGKDVEDVFHLVGFGWSTVSDNGTAAAHPTVAIIAVVAHGSLVEDDFAARVGTGQHTHRVA